MDVTAHHIREHLFLACHVGLSLRTCPCGPGGTVGGVTERGRGVLSIVPATSIGVLGIRPVSSALANMAAPTAAGTTNVCHQPSSSSGLNSAVVVAGAGVAAPSRHVHSLCSMSSTENGLCGTDTITLF